MYTSNNFTKGMNTDVYPKYQPEGSYRFAMNAVLETQEGDLPSISNELGNVFCANNFPTTKRVIGHVVTDTDDIVLALYDPAGFDEIGLFNSTTCTYTTVAKGRCFDFSDKYPVNIIFRIRNGCERVIYFTDNLNDYRVLNLTSNVDVVDQVTKIVSNCDKLLHTRPYSVPCFNLVSGNTFLGLNDAGGSLEIGTYSFAIRYMDTEYNPTDWIITTRSIPVADEPYNNVIDPSTVALYDGGSNVTTSPFYVPKVNKAIKLNLSGLDQNFKYYQIAVVKRTGDAGEISGVDLLFPVEILGGADNNFVYTGLDSQIQTQGSIDEVFAKKQPINKVVAQAQTDNRLYIGGVTNKTYDYSSFQRSASKIKTEWVSTNVPKYATGDKTPVYYFNNASFMASEVYALGIVYVHTDGTFSPVFHIPGRAPNVVTGDNPLIGIAGVADDGKPWDTGQVIEGQYGNIFNTAKKNRWQNISTATAYTSQAVSGLMGYWETATTYPTISTCDSHVDGYWGRDWQNNLLSPNVTKIRHHRMPGHEHENTIASPNDAFLFSRKGLKFTNLAYPTTDIVGHYFVYGDRTTERTIIHKGILVPLPEYGSTPDTMKFNEETLRDLSTFPTYPGTYNKTYAFITPEGLFDDRYQSGLYFKHERDCRIPQFIDPPDPTIHEDVDYDIEKYDTTVDMDTVLLQYEIFSDTQLQNYNIQYSGWLPKSALGSQFGNSLYAPVPDKTVINESVNTNVQIICLQKELHEVTTDLGPYAFYGSLCVDTDPFASLYSINYKRMDNCKSAKPTNTTTTYTSYSGDTFIGRLNMAEFSYSQSDSLGKQLFATMSSYLLENDTINMDFRHGAKGDPKYIYWQPSYLFNHEEVRRYFGAKYYEEADDIMLIYPESYNYNRSYSYMDSIDRYFPIPFGYEFCNDCIEKFPYRIYYSEQDNQELSEDKYRTIFPNNYKDLEGSTGPITDMFINFDQLYVTTPNTIYFQNTKPQTIQTDNGEAYLGTGEVLSLTAKQLKTTDLAFGGLNFFKSRINTEYGTAFVDDASGRVFLLTNQLNDLSNEGQRTFWQENGRVLFRDQFYLLTGIRFPFKSTSSPISVGYISTYDPRYKRIIIHKRDFKILPQWENNFTYVNSTTDNPAAYTVPNMLWFNNFTFYYNDPTSGTYEVPLEEITFFENKSFTVSYSFLNNSWISFHSYLPYYLFNGHKNLYSVHDTDLTHSSIFEHNKGAFQEYYGTKYPHIIDLIAMQNPNEIKYASNILYNSKTRSYSDHFKSWLPSDITYDGLIAYNTHQTTGYKKVVLKDTDFQSDDNDQEILVSKIDQQYRISNLRDMTVSNYDAIWDSS